MARPLLNVYGQDNPGERVIIIGNRAGIEALRKALKEGVSKVIASDGAEYELKIYHGDPEKTRGGAGRQFWKELVFPYHEHVGPQGTFISPWEWD